MSANNPTIPESYLGRDALSRVPTVQVVRHLISFLKWRFSLLPAGAYQWKPETEDSPDQTGSEIFIASDTPIRPEVVGARPAITVSRSALAFQGTGLGDVAYTDMNTGAKAFMDILPTHLVVNVLSTNPIEAETLAFFCVEQIWVLHEEIVSSEPSLLYIGSRPMISPPTPANALVAADVDHDWCVVSASFPAYLQHGAHKLPLNKRMLAHMNVNATVNSPTVSTPTRSVAPTQGTAVMQGKQLESEKISAVTQDAQLPQSTSSEASLSEPLTVRIET